MSGLNQYTELLYYIQSLGQADVFVNTITQGEFDKVDLDKANIFPLLHASITGASFTNGSTVVFNIQIGCFNVRETNKEINTDKYFDNDNEVDNMNETLAVLNRLWVNMYKNFQDNDITASENPTLEPSFEERTNLLDGWIMTFDAELPNTTLSLCPDDLEIFNRTFDNTFN